jgi:hypothetical protein
VDVAADAGEVASKHEFRKANELKSASLASDQRPNHCNPILPEEPNRGTRQAGFRFSAPDNQQGLGAETGGSGYEVSVQHPLCRSRSSGIRRTTGCTFGTQVLRPVLLSGRPSLGPVGPRDDRSW